MKKYSTSLIALSFCLLLLSNVRAQSIFSKTSAYAVSSAELTEYTSLVNSNNELVSVGSVRENGTEKAYFARYDLNGNFISGNYFSSGTTNLNFTEIKEFTNGDYFLAGRLDSIITGSLRTMLVSFRVDMNGNLLWTKTSNDMNLISTATDTKQGVVLLGDTALVGYASDESTGIISNFNLIKFNSIGDTIWTTKAVFDFNQISGMGNFMSELFDMILLSNGTILMVGKLEKSGISKNIILCYFDQNGNFIQSNVMDMGGVNYRVSKVRENQNNELVFYGIGGGGTSYGGMYFKTDLLGTFISGTVINDQGEYSIGKETQDGGMIIGTANSYAADASYPKIALHKYDALGNLEWDRAYGGQTGDNIRNILEFSNGNYIITGFTNSFNFSLGRGLYMNGIDSLGVTVNCQRNIVNYSTVSITLASNPIFPTTTFGTGASIDSIVYNQQPLNIIVSDIGYTINDTLIEPLCNGEVGMIDITLVGAQQPISYLWSNGTIAEDLIGVAGTYSVEVKDGYQCFDTKVITLTEPSVLQATYATINVDCFGASNGAITITSSGGTPGYSYSWSTLATTKDLNNVSGGFYQVVINDTNNCSTILGISVTEPQQLSAIITSTTNVSCNSFCDGQLAGFSAGGTSPYSYAWNDPSSQTSDTATGLCYGNYLLTVTDANGCLSYSNATVSEPVPLSNTITTLQTDCFASNGAAIASLSGGTPPYSYSWNGNIFSSNDSLGGLNVGTYSLDMLDANSCGISGNFSIESSTNPVEICVVTVDSATNKNMIIWTKPVSLNIQGYYIYRNIAGAYSQIGYQPYDSISEYVDYSFGVDPAITSYRYEISVLDSCGNESMLSNFHETMHLTSNLGLNGEVNLIWDSYEGFVFSQYNILRDSTGTGNWELINQVGSSSFTYTDQNPPQSSTLKYMVEVVLPATCSATKAVDHNTTRSNRATAVEGGNSTNIAELILSEAKIFPNPNNGVFTIRVQSDNWEYTLFDMSGKLISTIQVNENNTNVDIQNLETGIYLMKIDLEGSSIYKKIVKE